HARRAVRDVEAAARPHGGAPDRVQDGDGRLEWIDVSPLDPRPPVLSRAVGGPEPAVTFSIAAADPDASEVGVAVESKFLACAAMVSWARGGVGAGATQAVAEGTY